MHKSRVESAVRMVKDAESSGSGNPAGLEIEIMECVVEMNNGLKLQISECAG
jgi:hypothetical protein